MAIVFGIVIILTVIIAKSMTYNQEKAINSCTCIEEIEVDGGKRKIQKPKCPVCGNRELDYQIVSNPDSALKVSKNVTTIHSVANKYAVCKKCGNSFKVLSHTTPVANCIAAFIVSSIIVAVGVIILALIGII